LSVLFVCGAVGRLLAPSLLHPLVMGTFYALLNSVNLSLQPVVSFS